jgi:hypothetical protein
MGEQLSTEVLGSIFNPEMAGKSLKPRRRAGVRKQRTGNQLRTHTRACFRSGEIRILDSSGDLERTIAFSEAERNMSSKTRFRSKSA